MKNLSKELTVKEIRKVLFDTDKNVVLHIEHLGLGEMTNKQARDYFYKKDNQEQLYNVIDNGTGSLLIWGL